MQEYIQDALTFVREYGRPCLFITFTCNPKWPEITSLLLPGQNAIHRHDITARVFRQKLKSLISFITKSHVFGPTRCWMYSVEWQKRGLPHAHILVWFIDKIRPEEIDSIISAEIPDPSTDQLLFDIVTTNMIHGPCGTLNSSSPCMADGKCTKNFPKDFTNDTVTNVDGYPIYRRRNPENGGQSFIKNIINTDIDIDNRWVVPYSPLLSKTYNAHINVEFCSSVKSIKYICNSNEAAWRIFGFPIHERDPAVVQLAIHLENVNPRHTECFYLRLLLVNVTGPLSFQDIRKVNGQQYPTYKDACLALGLLEDDNQWECMLAEAALNCTAIQIRLLFAIVLTTCFPARAQILWENHKDSMTDDILHQHRIRCHDLTITFSDEMYNEALIAIEDLCIVIANLPLSNFGMNSPNRTASDLMNTEMNRELQYSTVEMAAIVARNVPLMNEEQRTIYDRIMLAVSAGQAKINMRVQMLQDPSAETFSKQLLDIGDGKVAIDETGYSGRSSSLHVTALAASKRSLEWTTILVRLGARRPELMRTGKRNRYRQPDSPDPNQESKRDDISINQLT
ncbi:hypothetical protein EVAR_15131_1 [Eumeta japonica]|uniref:Helitron helicase-like domain-containing protein n=1 Tax=Eumeta variegata TaxID=151549 RepID=A0A4C1UJ46_EUMVA|nr:hypothetical protein EVAR_15131_1 [Eumeta japonica]